MNNNKNNNKYELYFTVHTRYIFNIVYAELK